MFCITTYMEDNLFDRYTQWTFVSISDEEVSSGSILNLKDNIIEGTILSKERLNLLSQTWHKT